MGETIPPESKSQLAAGYDDDDAHEAVTIAPPAPSFEDMLSLRTPVPSLSHRSDQHFRAALDAGTRAGSSLSELSKIVGELSGGLSGAKIANEQLVQELSTLRAMLGSANEQQLGLKHQIATLEQELAQGRLDAERERQFLSEQHDEFLSALIEEHEEALARQQSEGDTTRMSAEVSDLAQKLIQAESGRLQAESARWQTEAEIGRFRELLAKTQTQRDDAQARSEKLERERDELRAEASLLRARLGTHRTASTAPPPPVTGSRPPSYRPPAALTLDAGELDSTLHARSSSSPRMPSVVPRFTPAPAELERAVYRPSPSGLTPPPSSVRASAKLSSVPLAPSSSSPSASAFPRESTRPGVGDPRPSEPPPPPSFGPPPSGWTPVPPASETAAAAAPVAVPAPSKAPRQLTISAASMLPGASSQRPILKQKPDPTTRPLVDYSIGAEGLATETLEGARLSSKPPRK